MNMRQLLPALLALLLLPSCATKLYIDWINRDSASPTIIERRENGTTTEIITQPYPSDQHVWACFFSPVAIPLAIIWDVVTLPVQLVGGMGPYDWR